METFGCPMDMITVGTEELAQSLTQFFAEVRPKTPNQVYHKNSLINIRAAINRHIQDIRRNPPVDIVRDKEFRVANGILDGILKVRMRSGEAVPTRHKPVIETADLEKNKSIFNRSAPFPCYSQILCMVSISGSFRK